MTREPWDRPLRMHGGPECTGTVQGIDDRGPLGDCPCMFCMGYRLGWFEREVTHFCHPEDQDDTA